MSVAHMPESVEIVLSTPYAPMTSGILGNGRRRIHPKSVTITAHRRWGVLVEATGPTILRNGREGSVLGLRWTLSEAPDWVADLVAEWRPLLDSAMRGMEVTHERQDPHRMD